MKKILTIILFVVLVLFTKAQLTVDSSKNFKAEVYAGVLVGPSINVKDSAKVSVFATLRAGGNIYWTPQRWFLLTGIASVEFNEKPTALVLYLVAARFKFHKQFFLTVGKIGSPMTEMRPFPNTMGGQFEPWTKRQIPGAAFGGKATFIINEKSSVVAGGFLRGYGDASVELGAKTRFVQLGGYYMVKARTFGAAATVTVPYVSQTLVYNHQQNFGSLTNITIPKTGGFGLFSDIGFTTNNRWDWVRAEWGVMKVFSLGKKVNALVALSYAHKNPGLPPRVYGYLQICL